MPCPSCGLTRAARLALHGELAAATRMHPLWFIVLPYVGAVGALECIEELRTGTWGRLTGRRWVKHVGALILALLVAVWFARELGALGGPVAI